MKINIRDIVAYLIFFPSVTFSVISAEIFPWATIFFLLFRPLLSREALLVMLMMIFSSVYSLFFTAAPFVEIVRSFAAYLNPLLIFLLILRVDDEQLLLKLKNNSNKAFFFLVILGLIQVTNLFSILNPVIGFIVPRGSATTFGAGGRGVTLMSTEPSRAAYEFIFFFLFYKNSEEMTKKKALLLDFGLLLFQVLVIRSGTGLFLTGIYFLVSYGYKLLIAFFPAIVGLSYFTLKSRAFEIARVLLSSVNISDAFFFLLNSSGFRLVSIVAGFSYGFRYIFGGGIGNWNDASIEAMESLGISPKTMEFFTFFNKEGSSFVGVRPTSYLSSFSLDFGAVGLLIIVFIFIGVLNKYWVISKAHRKGLVFFAIYLCFFGDTGNPVPWIATALFLRLAMFNSTQKKMAAI